MGALATLQHARELYRRDPERHLADIAVLKCDAFGVDARPHLRDALRPVRGWLPHIDLDRLRALPEGTFGRAYARFLDEAHLSPFRLTEAVAPDVRARNAYGIRYATTHDMFHVLLGFDTSWVGEMGVLAFAVGQDYAANLRLQALVAWVVYPLRSGLRLRALWSAWRRGLRLGRRAPFLLALRLEDRFADDLDALRAELFA
ncbi:MAG: Coq4 family protein [Myxococcota bacterium]